MRCLLLLMILNWGSVDLFAQALGRPFYGPRSDRGALGLNFEKNYLDTGEWTIVGGNLVVPIRGELQCVFNGGVGLADVGDDLRASRVSFPPSPYASFGFADVSPLWSTGLDWSSYISVYRASAKSLVDNLKIFSIDEWGLRSVLGISKRLKIDTGIVLIPFFEVSRDWAWRHTRELGVKKTKWISISSPSVGVTFYLPPDVSIWGSLGFYFDSSDQDLTIGVTWWR